MNKELEIKEARHKWLSDQYKFHNKLYISLGSKWHESQAKHYRFEMGDVFTFSEIVQRAFRRNLAKISANLMANNALFKLFSGLAK